MQFCLSEDNVQCKMAGSKVTTNATNGGKKDQRRLSATTEANEKASPIA